MQKINLELWIMGRITEGGYNSISHFFYWTR